MKMMRTYKNFVIEEKSKKKEKIMKQKKIKKIQMMLDKIEEDVEEDMKMMMKI